MTDAQRDCEAALARLQRAVKGEPEPPKRDTTLDELFRAFGMGAKDKEVRDAQ